MFSSRILLSLSVAMLLVATFSGCNKKKKKSETDSDGASYRYFLKESVAFDRFGDNTKARLSFRTSEPTHCKLVYFSQEDGLNPPKEKQTTVECSNSSEAATKYNEELSALDTATLYYIWIYVWPNGGTENIGDIVTFKESPSKDPKNDSLFRELFVTRLDIPLLEAEIHRHQLPAATDITSLKSQLDLKEGCKQGPISAQTPFRTAEGELRISTLTSSGFASGTAKEHTDYPQRLRLTYSKTAKNSEQWKLSYTLDGSQNEIVATPISRFLNIEMQSTETKVFGEPQIAEAEVPLKVDPEKPLHVSWTTGKILSNSIVTVQIGRPERDDAIYCVFPAKDLSGDIDAQMINALEKDKHVILVELSSNQLWAQGGWLINTIDWRSGRIER